MTKIEYPSLKSQPNRPGDTTPDEARGIKEIR